MAPGYGAASVGDEQLLRAGYARIDNGNSGEIVRLFIRSIEDLVAEADKVV